MKVECVEFEFLDFLLINRRFRFRKPLKLLSLWERGIIKALDYSRAKLLLLSGFCGVIYPQKGGY